MPLGILALSSCLHENGFKTDIYRPVFNLVKKEDFLKAANHILQMNSRFIGFSTWCNTFAASVLVAEQIKILKPEVYIIFGGPQASIIPTGILDKFSFIDFVLCGEADHTLPELLKELCKKEINLTLISGLYYRNSLNKITGNKTPGFVEDLDRLPIPAYDLIPETEILKLDVGRGCPYPCTFCSTNRFFSRKYRVKSPGRIISEMESVYGRTGITSFSFAHDMFTLNKKFIFDFCSKLIHLKKTKSIDFKWTCSARCDCVTEEMLIKMKAAGCHSIFFGIETGSAIIQNSIKKHLNLQYVLHIAEICMREKINMYASFIIGFPDEKKEDIEKTLELILKLACKGALVQISSLSVLPGTPLFTKFRSQLKFDGSFSNFSNTVSGKSEIQLIQKYPEIFSSFHYLPVKSISRKSLNTLCLLINALRDFRNTLFLIKDLVLNDIQEYELLHIFLYNLKEIEKNLMNKNTSASLLASHLIQNYIESKTNEKIELQTQNVFLWESVKNLLQEKYLKWKLTKPTVQAELKKILKKNSKLPLIKSTPVWQVFSVNSDLNQIIPEKNGWKKVRSANEGRFHYLLVAVSDKNSKLLSVNSKEYELLNVLRTKSEESFLNCARTIYSENKLVKWITYLKNTGVLVDISYN